VTIASATGRWRFFICLRVAAARRVKRRVGRASARQRLNSRQNSRARIDFDTVVIQEPTRRQAARAVNVPSRHSGHNQKYKYRSPQRTDLAILAPDEARSQARP
jgi:hypothetical protein